jgi:hypothetical protein
VFWRVNDKGRATKARGGMSQRIDKSWLVFISIENSDHDRCVDLFSRPDGTFGFEEFRRDVEDRGEWTPVSYWSNLIHPSRGSALEAAMQSVAWLEDAVKHSPSAQKLLSKNSA